MVKSREDGVLCEYACGIFDELLFDAFDSPHRVGVIFHLSLVDSSERAPAYNLNYARKYLLDFVEILDHIVAALHEELLLDVESF